MIYSKHKIKIIEFYIMGNLMSAHLMFKDRNINKNQRICYICSEYIKEKKFTICVRCEICLHNRCEESFRNTKYYTICPRCDRCGSLGVKITE